MENKLQNAQIVFQEHSPISNQELEAYDIGFLHGLTFIQTLFENRKSTEEFYFDLTEKIKEQRKYLDIKEDIL